MALAPEVRFSIMDEAADSERSSTEAKGAISRPISVSNRAISSDASSAVAAMLAGICGDRPAMNGTTAARYGPELRSRTRTENISGGILETQSCSVQPSLGQPPSAFGAWSALRS
jgi:hypothetical protein